ncbi:hypothetical protein NIES37_58580 [Tolypothrix tenuis PCC 7101]|uniref:Uncharacterized protein n=1 Tax=Tolypothrix tenuis PCC 7101 TaxID=231146 RepID=A0A1Z4N825_9CYAN|nr:FkbM family methyltransferase [Aulosira sp. FACHB-113]BAZ01851.1 hypothetical protein NIES37_58580 [Tolypothrix tenuis PCC 7101]BAZ74224.1 hypothetical protein NIES50_27950 [Aulosira laxa NIES-50]
MTKYDIDIIILSYAKNDALKEITIQGVNSLINSEDPETINFKILVIESNKSLKPYQYEHTLTVYPEEKFGFHRYLNLGIQSTNSPFVCLCNNDLIFEKNWASEILKEMDKDPLLLSASPYCPEFHLKRGFQKNHSPIIGYNNGILVGWCIFVKREIFDTIGKLDENLEFWYCDLDYAQTLQQYNIKHCLISSSFVMHLMNKTLEETEQKEVEKLTNFQYLYYDYKWNHKSKFKLILNYWILILKLWLKKNATNCISLVKTFILKFITRIHTALSNSRFATILALKIKNQTELVIRQRYSANSCNPELNGEYFLLEHTAPFCHSFVDVGANIGDWTEKFLKLGSENTNVIGLIFEPAIEAYESLRLRFLENSNTQICNLALSDCAGMSDFYEQPNKGQMSSLIQNFTETYSGQISFKRRVVISTLDREIHSIGWKQIDFLKIDTEGYDLKVIQGARLLLEANYIGIIQFEYNQPWLHTSSSLREAYQILESCGYEVFCLKPNGLFVYDIETFGDYYSYSNFVAVAKSHKAILSPLIKGVI